MSMDGVDTQGLSREARERLSAVADGEAGHDDLQRALAPWRDSPQARAGICETWHLYHLIGDVMRSDDLASTARGDAFVARLRERLAAEPPIVAPSPLPASPMQGAQAADEEARRALAARRRRRTWAAPVATAAGVLAVAGVLTVTRAPDIGWPGEGAGLAFGPSSGPAAVQPVALQTPPASAALPAASSAPAVQAPAPRPLVANGALLRDARLDQYLSAHKQFEGSSALGVPSGFLRSATYEGPNR